MMKVAIKNIKDGIITPSPIDENCKGCIFSDICKLAGNDEIQRLKEYNLKDIKILEIANARNK